MKERPILMSAPMVLASLDERKTQTRRIAKTVTSLPDGKGYTCLQKPGTQTCLPLVDGQWQWKPAAGDSWQPYPNIAEYCPHGQPGDRLWVRENGWERPFRTEQQMRDGADTWPRFIHDGAENANLSEWCREHKWKRRPSIHMPRWACRLTLDITDVRVERLQDISEADAMAEGAGFLLAQHEYLDGNPDQYRRLFQILWETINGPGSWHANPYVWAITFTPNPVKLIQA